ncbi:MAG: glycosyltransferase [Candidatus Limivicinus sp.]
MENKTLMFYINAIHDGGAERVLLQLAKRFADCGYRAVVVTSFVDEWEYPVPEGVERLSIEQAQIDQSRLRRNLSRIKALRRLIREYRPAALISFMAEPNFRAVIASRFLPVKTIVSVRNDPEREYAGRLGHIIGKWLLPLADGCVFQTEQAKSWFPKRLQRKASVIMNQVDARFFQVEGRGEAGYVMTAGRLTAQKNQALLIRAFAAIAGDVKEELRIYGEGELRPELEALIARLGMEQRIKLMGASDDMPAALEGCKLFVLPSDFEGMPNALLEAMAAGRCCVSTACPCGGPEAVIENGVNGMLVPVREENALSGAMLELLKDEEKRRTMAAAAGESAAAFRPEAIFEHWRAYVERVIG